MFKKKALYTINIFGIVAILFNFIIFFCIPINEKTELVGDKNIININAHIYFNDDNYEFYPGDVKLNPKNKAAYYELAYDYTLYGNKKGGKGVMGNTDDFPVFNAKDAYKEIYDTYLPIFNDMVIGKPRIFFANRKVTVDIKEMHRRYPKKYKVPNLKEYHAEFDMQKMRATFDYLGRPTFLEAASKINPKLKIVYKIEYNNDYKKFNKGYKEAKKTVEYYENTDFDEE